MDKKRLRDSSICKQTRMRLHYKSAVFIGDEEIFVNIRNLNKRWYKNLEKFETES